MIELLSESYTLQQDTTCYGQISTAGELVVKEEYMNCMHDYKNCQWEQS